MIHYCNTLSGVRSLCGLDVSPVQATRVPRATTCPDCERLLATPQAKAFFYVDDAAFIAPDPSLCRCGLPHSNCLLCKSGASVLDRLPVKPWEHSRDPRPRAAHYTPPAPTMLCECGFPPNECECQ